MFKPRGRARFPRLRQKMRRPLGFRHMLVISFMIFMGLTVWGLIIINAGIRPTLMAYANTKTENVATKVINVAVNKQLKEMNQGIEFVKFEKDNNGQITGVVINTENVNMVATTVTTQVQNYLKMLENGKLEEHLNSEGIQIQADQKGPLITTVPLGLATKNSLLSNLGPQVPVRFQVIGNVDSTLKDEKKQVGINWINVQVYVHLRVHVRVIIPFATKPKTVQANVPLVNVTVPGDVPLYYGGNGSNNGGNSPALVLPSKKKKGNQ